MKNGVLISSVIALVFFFISKSLADTGILGNGYYGIIEILITLLIWTVIVCTFAVINAIEKNK